MKKQSKKILFLCTSNSARSQMAEVLANAILPNWEALSAGSAPTKVHPAAIAVMNELGIDMSKHHSKNVKDFPNETFDYVVTLCDEANAECPYFPNARSRLHRGFLDPAKVIGNPEEQLAAFRKTRDQIKAWLVEEFLTIGKGA